MRKSKLISQVFGSQGEAARACTLTKAAVSQWPDTLTIRQIHELIGAAVLQNRLPHSSRILRALRDRGLNL